ncbi:NB-ARC domain-containing protein [Mycena venus]|uniref:NB-ARC domain-containing protein n=1 Tax=Mycena venus TaxID=2733690 RepID=A0A8H7CTQ1_9AGAR|nr:NB-ARC domain-containing protein [Mycena venus]
MTPHISPNALEKILQYTAIVAKALKDVAATSHIPFLDAVCTVVLTITPLMENIKLQKDRCLRMMEEIHQLLCVLMGLCIYSEDIRSREMLHKIAHFATTLQKFQSCIRELGGLGKFKRFFKQSEITAQLDSCEKELRTASEIFTTCGVGIASTLIEFNVDTEKRHQELLELISSRSDSFDNLSSIRSSLNTSSSSLSLLPASPKVFHGRDSELKDLINSLLVDPARVVILGPGGIGKTTLAMAALHNPEVMEKYVLRHFISCESTSNRSDLVINIGSHLGLEPSPHLSKAIVRHLGECGPCLVVLDNFETPWEHLESRGQVEEFISLLADIPTLALLITMRGAERPGKVKWNRPFLPPLEPLSSSASRQIFIDVADEPRTGTAEESALNDLLDLSDHLPLAVTLMANIASFEGYPDTLARWQIENTSLLSDGHDKESNLEKSITLSLGSQRISSSPHAKNLLALLSLLPDGIMAQDIMASKVPIPDVCRWQSLLVGTSLAYIDVKGRLKTLNPIREYIRRVHPPSPSISKPLRTYFRDLLELWRSNYQCLPGNIIPELVSYLGNINELMLEGLITEETAVLVELGHGIITLDSFSWNMLNGNSPLFQRVPHLIHVTGSAELRWRYAASCLRNPDSFRQLKEDPDVLIQEGAQYFGARNNTIHQGVDFYNAAAEHYLRRHPRFFNLQKAAEFNKLAFTLAESTDDIELQLLSLRTEAIIANRSKNPYWELQIAYKARRIGRFASNHSRLWQLYELAMSNFLVGNIAGAFDFSNEMEELLISSRMESSRDYLHCLYLRAQFHFQKSEYIEGRQLHARIVNETSSKRLPTPPCPFSRQYRHSRRSHAGRS